MSSLIDDYVKRPMLYDNTDGINELMIGALWIGLPLLEFFKKTADSASVWHRKITFIICAAAFAFVLVYGRRVLKKHITYPRTGYVKYRQKKTMVFVSRVVAMPVAVAVAVAIGTVFVLRRMEPHSSGMIGAALGSATWGLFYVFITRMEEAWRWVVLVALIVAPPVVATLPLGRLWLGNSPVVLIGLIYFVSGAITLTLYLRRNPVPEEGAE